MKKIQRLLKKKPAKIPAKINGQAVELDGFVSTYGDIEEVKDNDPILENPETIIINNQE